MYTIYALVDTYNEPEIYVGYYTSLEKAQDAKDNLIQEDWDKTTKNYQQRVDKLNRDIQNLRISLHIPETITDKQIVDNHMNWRYPYPPASWEEFQRTRDMWYDIREIEVQ
jgi:hypothetical protein